MLTAWQLEKLRSCKGRKIKDGRMTINGNNIYWHGTHLEYAHKIYLSPTWTLEWTWVIFVYPENILSKQYLHFPWETAFLTLLVHVSQYPISGSRGRHETQTWPRTPLISLGLSIWSSNGHMPQSETNGCQDFSETNRRETLYFCGLGAMSMLAWSSINRMHEIETNIQNKINWEMESIQDLMESFDHWELVVPKSWIPQLH